MKGAKRAGFEGVGIALVDKNPGEELESDERTDKGLGLDSYRNDDFTLDTPRERIKKIYIKDFKGEIGNITGFVQLLAGDLDWPKTIEALVEIGYDDFLVAQLCPL